MSEGPAEPPKPKKITAIASIAGRQEEHIFTPTSGQTIRTPSAMRT
jgi:hypothetical protein